MTQQRTQINLDSLDKIFVVKSEHTVDEVLQIDAEHPNLLIIDESARLVIQPILAK